MLMILGVISFGIGAFIAMIVWSFLYNKYYTRKLIEKGYQFDDTPELNKRLSNLLASQKIYMCRYSLSSQFIISLKYLLTS